MNSEATTPQNKLRLLARLKQIKDSLIESDKNEAAARSELIKDVDSLPLNLEVRFLTERVELYNEKAQIESDLVHMGVEKPTDSSKDEILTLAKDLDLASNLREERTELLGGKGCWTNCEVCVTDCTECVTNCGLAGESIGGPCIGGTLVSACRPNPGF